MSSASHARADREAMVSVMVVDDQAPFRRAARALVEATPGFAPVGDADSGAEALRRVGQFRPDLVLMDVFMPGMDGFETARRLNELHPGCVVVLVSLEDTEDLPALVASTGAVALVRKQDLNPSLLRELWAIHGRAGGAGTESAREGHDGGGSLGRWPDSRPAQPGDPMPS